MFGDIDTDTPDGFVMVFALDCAGFVGHQTSQPMSAASDKAGKNARQIQDR